MSPVAPYSDLFFCTVPWDSSYRNVCDTVTTAWIGTKTVKAIASNTYIRRDTTIRVDCDISEIKSANYLMYRNKNHENKWWFAFIRRMGYINEGVTEVEIQTDVYQSWRSQLDVKPCFVVREHVNDDTVGANTIPEGLETGEFVNANSSHVGLNDLSVVVAAKVLASDGSIAPGTYHSGLYHGCVFYKYDADSGDLSDLQTMINSLTGRSGGVDNILAIFMIPTLLVPGTGAMMDTPSYTSPSITHTAPARPTLINGYAPKNNKLFTYPYTFLFGYNGMGGTAVYRYEHFVGTPQFHVYGAVGPDTQVKAVPLNKGTNDPNDIDQFEEAITISGWPMCMWAGSAWANFQASHPGATAQGLAGVAMAVMGIAAGGAIGGMAVMGGISAAFGSASAILDKAIAPPQTGGSVSSAPANIAGGIHDIYFISKTVKNEYAKVIDEFFSMYGYKVNRVKVPNTKGRLNWNYVQTADAVIQGAMPDDDRKTIIDMFNRGVTFWHSPDKVGQYALDNEVT